MESNSKKEDHGIKGFLKRHLGILPLKIVILSFSAGVVCTFPFFVLQMKILGLNINEIALVFLITPVASIIGPVVSGLVADKLGKYSLIFAGNVILMACFENLLLIIPPVEQNTANVTCNQGILNVVFDNCNDCINNLQQMGITEGQLILKNCKPCLDENVEGEKCLEDFHPAYVCPVFNYTDEVMVNFTTNITNETSSLCGLTVSDVNHSNMSYVESDLHCNRKRCDFKCEISKTIEECHQSSAKSKTTFILILCTMFGTIFFASASFTMMDATILQYVQEHRQSLAKQKIMTVIAYAITPLLAGVLIDLHSKKIGSVSYLPAFMLSNVLLVVTCVTTYFVSIKVAENKSNIIKNLGKLVTRLDVDIFLLLVLILGCNFGFIESYIFIFLQSLGAPNFLLGLTMTVGCLSSIPMLFWADWLQNKIGRHFIFLICFTAYSVRMLGYSFIKDPWLSLIFESLEAVTYQLMWVTCLKLCPLLAPEGLLATMTGITGAIHYSFGKGIGGFVGGRLIAGVGIRNAFRVFAGFALFGGVFYIVVHYCFLKERIEKREKELEKEQEAAKKEKDDDEEEKPMLIMNNNLDKLANSGISIDLQHSFLARAGSRNGLSLDGVIFNETYKENKDINGDHKEKKSSSHLECDFISSICNGSMPHLYIADAYDILARLDMQELSRSEGNIHS